MWILFGVMMAGLGWHSVHIEFTSKVKCEAAVKQLEVGKRRVILFCFEK